MPKMCPKCGTIVDDRATFCGACGASIPYGYSDDARTVSAQDDPYRYEPPQQYPNPQPTYQQSTYQQPAYPQQTYQQPAYQQPAYQQPINQQPAYQQYPSPQFAPRKQKKTGVIIVASILVLLVVAAAVLIVFLPLVANIDVFGLNLFSKPQATPQACMDKFIDCLAEDDMDGVLDCIYETKYSDFMRSYLKLQITQNGDSLEGLGEIRSMGKENVRKIIVLTVSNEVQVSDTEATAMKKTLTDNMVPADKITRIVKADVHMENKKENETNDEVFYFAVAEGKYYILASASSM